MIPLTVADVASGLAAELSGGADPAARLTAVTADSRRAGPGTLFVALPGEHADGHDYAAAAVAAGTPVALTARPLPGVPALVVDDPLAALGRLARMVVDRAKDGGLRVVGITGSSGKTSTKDLLAQVLEATAATVAPAGNLNNELGVPLTVARVEPDTRFLVAEMGARGIGHIAYLCRIAPPDVAVVLNVGVAHVGEFGGQPAIAQAKGELVEALSPEGVAVLNADDPLVWGMRSRTRGRVLAFAPRTEPAGPGVWATEVRGDASGRFAFRLHVRTDDAESRHEVQLGLVGEHHVANALAATAAALALGLDVEQIVPVLRRATPRSRWRMEVTEHGGVTVVNDAYNANPDSMRAAVAALARLGDGGRRTTWAVLGDMLELGPEAPAEHTALGRLVAASGIDHLIAVGEFAEVMAAAAGPSARAVADRAEAVGALLSGLGPTDVVLVKASRGLALEAVAEAVLATPAPGPTQPPARKDPA